MISGIHYKTQQPVVIETKAGRVVDIKSDVFSKDQELLILPGLFDLQINGYAGVDFNSKTLSYADMEKAISELVKRGVTSFLPTLVTNGKEAISERLSFLAAFRKESKWGSFIAGFHLEGPFITLEDGPRGAHMKAFVQKPDWTLIEKWQECAENGIKIITLSPEWEGSEAVIQRCVEAGIKVAIGHTAASAEQIAAAARAGATLSTHLGNGAHPVLARHPNYIWSQLANDALWITFIADGFHLPPEVISVFLKVKKEKAVLVSDAVSFAGCKPGIYESHIGGKVQLTEKGRLQMLSDPRLLAGSASDLFHMVHFLADRKLAKFDEAWEMGSLRPYKFLYDSINYGLTSGSIADFVLLKKHEGQAELVSVYKAGEPVNFA